MRKLSKSIAALGIGVLLSLGLLAALETALRLNQAYEWIDLRSFAFWRPENSFKTAEAWDGVDKKFLAGIPDRFREIREKYGSRGETEQAEASSEDSPLKDGSYRYFRRAPEGETIFDILYRYNEKQRRPTPGQPKAPATSILLVGDSFVLGEGVGENETIAAYMQMGLKHTAVESVAFHGWGINSHLRMLRGEPALEDQPNPYRILEKHPVIVVYAFLPDHIYRATCPLLCYRSANEWMLRLPNYMAGEGRDAEYLGTFLDSRRFSSVLRWVANSAIVTQLGLDWPPPGSANQLEKYFGILNTYRKELGERVTINDFYFVPIAPYFPFGDKLGQMAQENEYNLLDLKNLALPEMVGRNPRIPFDGHYTAPANYILSRLILSRIRKDHPDIR